MFGWYLDEACKDSFEILPTHKEVGDQGTYTEVKIDNLMKSGDWDALAAEGEMLEALIG
jgi:hypothetical protein